MVKAFYVFLVIATLSVGGVQANTESKDSVLQQARQFYFNLVEKQQAGQNEIVMQSFEKQFQFKDFAKRSLVDVSDQLSDIEHRELLTVFKKLFYKNLRKNQQKLFKHRFKSPVLKQNQIDSKTIVVHIFEPQQSHEVALYFNTQNEVVDIEISKALLSRQYRGTFNRSFRKGGFEGLKSAMLQKLNAL